MKKDLQKFSFGRSGFENVRDGDGRVAVGEVGVVPTAGDRDAEAVARNSLKNNIVVLPDYPLATLKEKKCNRLDFENMAGGNNVSKKQQHYNKLKSPSVSLCWAKLRMFRKA